VSKSQFRYTIKGNGTAEPLFSMSLTKHGDAILTVKGMEKVRQLGLPTKMLGSEGHNEEIREFRFTVHPTPNDANLNRINLHHVLKTGKKLGFAGRTDAIKKPYSLAMLFSRYGRGLGLSKSNAVVKNIGSYDPSAFTIHWYLFVSHPDFFIAAESNTTNHTSEVVGDFRFTLLWSFLPMASMPIGATTMAYGQTEDETIVSLLHYDMNQAFAIHNHTAEVHYQELVDTLMNALRFGNLEERGMIYRRLSRFALFKEGTKDNFAYHAHVNGGIESVKRRMTVHVMDAF
jgi:hypothetical protein